MEFVQCVKPGVLTYNYKYQNLGGRDEDGRKFHASPGYKGDSVSDNKDKVFKQLRS